MATEARLRGTMLWYSLDRDEGVVESESGERLPVKGPGFAGGARPERRCSGTPVTFRGVDGEAVDVMFIPEADRARARSRRGGYR
jgi:hypothetical protein